MAAGESTVRTYEELPEQVRRDLPRISRCLIERDFPSLAKIVSFDQASRRRFEEEIEVAMGRCRQRNGDEALIRPIDESLLRGREYLGGDDDPEGWHLFVPVFQGPDGGESDLKFVFNARRDGATYRYDSFAVYVP